jgi:hypothetical protein
MSAQNKRRNVLIGFGAVAVVLVAVVAMWPPNWPREQASAAIGAVEKHRETQITPSDVVLTDEKTKQEDAVLYADFLNDAARLQNISAELSAALRNDEDLQARGAAARASMMNLEADLQARYASQYARTLDAMSRAVAANESTLDASKKAALQSDIDQLSAQLKARTEWRAADMDAFNARLSAIDDQLQARAVAVRKAGGEQLESDLAALEAQKSLQARDVEKLQARLDSISRDLKSARMDARPQIAYLGILASQVNAMQLGKIDWSGPGVRSGLNFAKLSARLSAEAEQMEAQAARNLQARLNHDAEMAARLQSMDRAVVSARQLASRSAATIDSRIQNNFQASLKEAEQLVGARKAEYQAKLAGRISSELSAIDRYLNGRAQMAAKLANEDALAAKLAAGKLEAKAVNARLSSQELEAKKLNATMVEARSALRARLNASANFAKYLANLDQALNGNREFAALAQKQQLALEARGLAARLEARSN